MSGEFAELTLMGMQACVMIQAVIRKKKQCNTRSKRQQAQWTREWLNRRHAGRGLLHKANTNMRESVPPNQRLSVTLRFLATGETCRSLMYSTRIHESTLSLLIPETLWAIYQHLKGSYMNISTTSAQWKLIATDFAEKWNFPCCIGSLDGKHINFRPPASSGSYFYNYKGAHSIVLLALVDANYKFVYVDVGVNGRVSGGVFRESSLKLALENDALSLPENVCLSGQTIQVPHVIIADEAFLLTTRNMKPFAQRGLTREKRICNYRFSRARRVVENAFGILANRFRILLNTINLAPNKVEDIVLACCVLHNYLATETPNTYLDTNDEQVLRLPGIRDLQGPNRPRQEALQIRDNFMRYFNGVGAVSWQDRCIQI